MDVFYLTPCGLEGCVQVPEAGTVAALKDVLATTLGWEEDGVCVAVHGSVLDTDAGEVGNTALEEGSTLEVTRCTERIIKLNARLALLPQWAQCERNVVLHSVAQHGADLKDAQRFADDREIVETALKQDYHSLAYASDSLKDDFEIATMALSIDGDAFRYLGPELRDTPEFALASIGGTQGGSFRCASLRLRDDLQFMEKVVRLDAECFAHAGTTVADNESIAMIACTSEGRLLERCSPRLRSSRHLVTAAITSSKTHPVLHMSPLHDDRELNLLQIQVCPSHYNTLVAQKSVFAEEKDFVLWGVHAVPSLVKKGVWKDDFDVMYAAVEHGGMLIAHASAALRADRRLVIKALKFPNAGTALLHADKSLRHDREVALAAVTSATLAVLLLPEPLRADRLIAETVLRTNGSMLRHFPECIKNDVPLTLLAVDCHNEAMSSVGSSALPSVRTAFDAINSGVTERMLDVPEPLRDDALFVGVFVKRKGTFLEYASQRLREDEDTVTSAVAHTAAALQFAGDTLKGDPTFVRKMCTLTDGAVLPWVSKELQDNA